jgi:hypothetical protein
VDVQAEVLNRFEKKHSHVCPDAGYEVYVALLNVPAEGIRTTASELGHRWGVLGGRCANGIVALLSTRDRVVSIAADPHVQEHVLPPQLEGYIERSALGILRPPPDVVVSSIVSQLSLAMDGKLNADHSLLMQSAATILLYGVTCCMGLTVAVLMICGLYDAAAHWSHRSHFHSCQKKVQRVHEVFLNRRGELPLCPCCVEFVSNQPSPSVVVFLCGHRFHTDCANYWFLKYPNKSGRCPICEGADAYDNEVKNDADEMSSPDDAKRFFLNTLHERYPDIIPKANIKQWSQCHTELWLSELKCPRYHSIFQSSRKECSGSKF